MDVGHGPDLLDPVAVERPHAYLAPFRDRDPICWSERHRAWMITGHHELAEAFRDLRLSTERMEGFRSRLSGSRAVALEAAIRLLDGWMLFHEPPTHGRLRNPLSRSFTPRATARLAPEVQAIADRLIDELLATGSGDLVSGFCHPLPAAVIAELFGVPPELDHWLASWSEQFGVVVFGATARADYEEAARASGEEFTAVIGDLMSRYRAKPADNLLSVLLATEGRHDGLSTTEIIGACSLLLFAGHDTTASLLGSGTVALLQRPEQARRLRSGEARPDVAVEELLRFEPPAKAMVRTVAETHDRHGHHFEAGQGVFMTILAANRDPRVFPQPDHLDLDRDPNPHLSFGFGHHFCLGAALARLEARIALPTLLRRVPELRLVGDVTWKATISDRSPTSIPIAT